jgi:hypothetical protein
VMGYPAWCVGLSCTAQVLVVRQKQTVFGSVVDVATVAVAESLLSGVGQATTWWAAAANAPQVVCLPARRVMWSRILGAGGSIASG